jgi:hypothetical protein
MSADAHRQETARHRREAIAEEAQYHPEAQVHVPAENWTWQERFPAERLATYNPTAVHLELAERHQRYAHEHERAARALEAEEARACGALTLTEREACPFVTAYVLRVQEVKEGVWLVMKDGAPSGALASRMKCHLAFAKTRGFKGGEQCPLYLKGAEVEWLRHRNVIAVTSHSKETAAMLRGEARSLFGYKANPVAVGE